MKELTDLTPALTPTAQTALRAIKTLRQYDLPTSAEAERSVLQSLSVEDCTAVILALSAPESKSESLSPSERVSQILDWLVRSAQTELQANVDRIIQLRTTNPDNELSVDPKQVLQELELRYKERTREFVRALVHAGLSNTVIAGLWSVFERSNTNKYDTDNITRNIRRLGKTIMLTSSQVDRFELSDTAAVLAHIEATIDDLEIQDIDSLPKDTYRVKVESKDAVIQYLRNSGVLDVPEIDIYLSAVRDGFIVDLTALEVRPVPDAPLSPAALERTAKEIAIAVVKRWKYTERTEEDTGLTEDQLTRKLEQAIRSGAMGPQTKERFALLCQVAESLLRTVPTDVIKDRWLERLTDFALSSDDPITFEQVLTTGEELKWKRPN